MKKTISIFATAIVLSITAFAQDEAAVDAPGCKDSPLFNRMPNTIISVCTSNFDEMDIPMTADNTDKKEGTKTSIQYGYTQEEATAPSFFQIVKNYENAVLKTGGKRIYYSKEAGVATLYTKSGGKEIWVVLNDFGGTKQGNFEINILEIEGMKQDISANEMLEAINKNGSVALYINFETGKSAIKPESQSIVDQVSQMLKESPGLKISVEGHTDNTGTVAGNQTLSESRAKTVMNALIAKDIDKTRLSSKGWGQSKPIADNSSDDGKAKNRRVEIVKL